jgi:ribokinase
MELAHKQGVLVLLNAAPVQPLTERDLQKVDVLVVNEIEAQGLAGCKVTDMRSARVAAHKLSQYIPKVVITLGGKGALWCTKYNEYGYQQAFDVHVVDTTGAGDAFVGALAKMLVQNAEWDKALRIATAAGALAVGRAGAQSSLPTQDEVNTMLEKMQIENQR